MDTTSSQVMVYGASGHTGRFIVDELRRRGVEPVLAGRSTGARVFGLDDAGAVRRGLDGIGVVINAAGPFLDTALPLARGAVAAGAHYLDVTAEQPAAQELYRAVDGAARDAGVTVVPAMAFYGALSDLLATALLDGEPVADAIDVAFGLDHWWPTAGSLATGARNTAPRLVVRGGGLVPLGEPDTRSWTFLGPLGEQEVVAVPFTDVVTIARHLDVGEVGSYLTAVSLAELRDPSTQAPAPVDEAGRSAQRFVVEVAVRRGAETRRASVAGRDIYAVSAPIVVEGALRLLDGRGRTTGAVAPGSAFDAAEVLAALEREVPDLSVTLPVRA
ncbi:MULTISPECIES: saccharopine dehydrogenase family protein [Nocardioides]|nr:MULTISPECIES: saccharopine dehydrogenase NADP-binding domain-containing protein [unclassified Nocardioides]